MLVGRCLNANSTLPASRSQACPQRCCAFISSTGHQQAQLAQAAARTSATSEVCQSGIVAPVGGHLSELFQLLDKPQSELSVQAQLNDRLTRCTSWEELAALLDANLDILDFVNISTAWTRLANLFKQSGQYSSDGWVAPPAPPSREPAFRRFLAVLIDVTTRQLHVFGVQALANVMWALSNADWQLEQHEPAVGKLMHEWCASVHERLPDLRAPDISNISTAIGRLDHRWRPDFVVEFYRSVLHREDLLEHLDLTTLNNLLYGMSRARRRRLTHIGPAARHLLGDCVDRLLERPDREAAGLVPWRAAQLLYNCHKVKLRMRPNSYAVLMPLVAQLYGSEPGPGCGAGAGASGSGDEPRSADSSISNTTTTTSCSSSGTHSSGSSGDSTHSSSGSNPLDRWSFGFLTAFVAAHRNVHPAVRPDLRPLYAYVERRLPEASTSQLAMLAHMFRDLGCPPPAPFWGRLFARYLVAQAAEAPQVQAPQWQHDSQQQQQWQMELSEGRAELQQQQQHGESLQVQVLSPQARHAQQQQQYPLMSRQLALQVQHHQQQAAQALQLQQRSGRVAWGELPRSNGHPPELHRPAQQGHRLWHSQQQQQQPLQQQLRQAPHASPHQSRRPLHPQRIEGSLEALQAAAAAQQQLPDPPGSPPQLTTPQSESEMAVFSAPQQQQAQEQQQQLEQSRPLQGHPHSILEQQQQYGPSPHPHARPHPHPHARLQTSYPHPQPACATPQYADIATAVPRIALAMARAAAGDAGGGGGGSGREDDLTEPRTLHYVCWQAAKAGILPPRVFLRLYVERVPPWLVRCADDTQVAQAVETLRLLRWVPRRELRDMLCATLERRAATSRLPMRSLLRWVRQQR